MKRTTNYQVTYVNELLNLAEISAKSTIKYLYIQSVNEYTRSIRFGLLGDVARLERERNTVEEIARLEKTVVSIDEEIKLTEKTIREIEDVILDLKGELYEEQRENLFELNSYIKILHKERKLKVEEINLLYKVLGERLTDGLDLLQVSVCAIWECMPILKAYSRHGKLNVENVGELIVKCHTIKKTGEKRYITLKGYSDSKIREYVNNWKRKKEYKDKEGKRKTCDVVQYITVGYDDEGNELLLQDKALVTMGGIASFEELQNYHCLLQSIENVLTEGEKLIIKMLLQGKTQEEIGKKLNLKQNSISDKIKRIRNKIAKLDIEGVKKYLSKK